MTKSEGRVFAPTITQTEPILTVRSREMGIHVQSYRRKVCSECGRKMLGVQRLDAAPAYCGDWCARLAQPHAVITGKQGVFG